MKLDHECVRDLLLTTEETEFGQFLQIAQIMKVERMSHYDKNQVIYVIQKLKEAGFINASVQYASDVPMWVTVNSLTWNGHKFLDDVRDDGIWKETKSKISSIAGVSLQIISDVASSVIKSKLGLS